MARHSLLLPAGVVALVIAAVIALPLAPTGISAVFAAPSMLQATPSNGAPLPPSVDDAVASLPSEISVSLLASAEVGGLRSNGNLLSLERVALGGNETSERNAAGSELVVVESGSIELTLGGQTVAIETGGQFVASLGNAYAVTAGAEGAELLRLRFEQDTPAPATPSGFEQATPAAGALPQLLASGNADRLVSRRGTLFIATVVVPPGVETGTQSFTGPTAMVVTSGTLTVQSPGVPAVAISIEGDVFLPAFTEFTATNDGSEPAMVLVAGLLAPPTGEARGPEETATAAASPTADALGTAQAQLTALAENVATLATREADVSATVVALQTALATSEAGSSESAAALATAEADLLVLSSALSTAQAASTAAAATAQADTDAAAANVTTLEATIVALQTQVASAGDAAAASDATALAGSAALESTVTALQNEGDAAATAASEELASSEAAHATAEAELSATLEAEQDARATADAVATTAAGAAATNEAAAQATIAAQAAQATAFATELALAEATSIAYGTTLAGAEVEATEAANTAATEVALAEATAIAYGTALAGADVAATAAAEAANATIAAQETAAADQASAANATVSAQALEATAAAEAAAATIAAQATTGAGESADAEATIAAGASSLAAAEATIAALSTAQADAAGQALASLNPSYVEETIQVNLDAVLAGDETAITEARAELRRVLRKYRDDCRAGVVLTFGHGRTIGEGVRLAAAVNLAIQNLYPTAFGGAGYDAFGNLNPPLGQVDIRIYFFTGCAPAEAALAATGTPEAEQ